MKRKQTAALHSKGGIVSKHTAALHSKGGTVSKQTAALHSKGGTVSKLIGLGKTSLRTSKEGI
jgi:hypothetical protein